jgi:hypothetical protein
MARYKGRSSSKAVERDLPHIVEIVVPPGCLGKQLDACRTGTAIASSRCIAVAVDAKEGATSSAGALPMRKTAADFAAAFRH